MALESFVGRWKGGPAYSKGIMAFLEAVGKADKFKETEMTFVTEVKREGAAKLVCDSSVCGFPHPVRDVMLIGGNSKQNFPGLGEVEVNSTLDGNKIISRSCEPYRGQHLTMMRHVQDDCVHVEISHGDAVMRSRYPREGTATTTTATAT